MQFNVSFITMFPAAVYLFPIIDSPLHLLGVMCKILATLDDA